MVIAGAGFSSCSLDQPTRSLQVTNLEQDMRAQAFERLGPMCMRRCRKSITAEAGHRRRCPEEGTPASDGLI
jgi:hypothetical protein